MKQLSLLALLLGFSLLAQSQDNVWNTLFLIKYETGGKGNGKFEEIIRGMDGDEITVRGYIVPLSGKRAQSQFMFSAYPYNMCFFCGGAGPESIMEAFMKEGKTVEFSEKPITLKGTFRYIPNTETEIVYRLENAVKVNE
jgi:hypothetical protein